MSRSGAVALCLALAACIGGCATGDATDRVVLGTTHTLEDSGLLEVLAAAADTALPLRVAVVVAGSGEILAMAANGDLDVLLTHSPSDEQAFIASGGGAARYELMFNDFVLAGPAADPAGISGAPDAIAAFARLDSARAPFVSRADDSGTHRAETALWERAGVRPAGDHYIRAGAGMAEALRLATQRGAYVLSDRGTWARLADELAALRLLYSGDPAMRNQYSIVLPRAAADDPAALRLVEWLRSAAVARIIADFGQDAGGRPLFTPNEGT